MKRYVKASVDPGYVRYAFEKYAGGNRNDYFSDDGLEVIAEYIDSPEDVDVVAICGYWTEYDNANDVIDEYEYLVDRDDYDDDEDFQEAVFDAIEQETSVWYLKNGNTLLINF